MFEKLKFDEIEEIEDDLLVIDDELDVINIKLEFEIFDVGVGIEDFGKCFD